MTLVIQRATLRVALAMLALAPLLPLVGCADEVDRPADRTHMGPGMEAPGNPDAAAADNTARNERDRDPGALTPLDQSESGPDIDITAQIRREILADDQMSTDAKNAKIMTSGGVVTLRGPVANSGERMAVEAKARAVAGVTRVDNQLESKAP